MVILKRKLFSVVLVICLIMGLIPNLKAQASTVYSPRLSAPGYDNGYYYSNKNPYYESGYGMPNCTAYAYGRVYEYLGSQPKLSLQGAGYWWSDNLNNGWYSYGSTPKLGAVACWDQWSVSYGHVAVVEQINGDGTIVISESSWSGVRFRTATINADGSGYYGNLRFRGFIYPLSDAVSADEAAAAETAAESKTEEAKAEESKTEESKAEESKATLKSVDEIAQEVLDGKWSANEERRVMLTAAGYDYDTVQSRVNELVKARDEAAAKAAEEAAKAKKAEEAAKAAEDVKKAEEAKVAEDAKKAEEPKTETSSSVVAVPVLDISTVSDVRYGNVNNSVKLLQGYLNQFGYWCGPADGYFGSQTYSAVVSFQKANGLVVDGYCGRKTWGAIATRVNGGSTTSAPATTATSAPAASTAGTTTTTTTAAPAQTQGSFDYTKMAGVSYGSFNNSVGSLQKLLNNLGYSAGPVDNYFGAQTRQAVSSYQRDHGLVVDGYCGPQTWKSLANA